LPLTTLFQVLPTLFPPFLFLNVSLEDLPRNVHLLSFRPVKEDMTPLAGRTGASYLCLMRLQHMYEVDTPYTPFTTVVNLNLREVWSNFSLRNIVPTTLSANGIIAFNVFPTPGIVPLSTSFLENINK